MAPPVARERILFCFACAEEAGPSTSAAEPAVPTFLAFAGSGKRLDGKSAAPAAPVPIRLGTYEVRVACDAAATLTAFHRDVA